MIRKVLVANRGEIAVRIFQTLKEMGIATVAVYSDPDADAVHTITADEAHRLEGTTAAETYLNIKKILQAAARCGADAIHPGYGFLSENASFADACEQGGLIFIGPKAETIRRMGDKIESKRIMQAAGVPTLPALLIADVAAQELNKKADAIGFPLLVKAASGGGGKGMRLVRDASELALAIESAQREAEKAFGDARMFLEKYIENPRHVEFQIFGDRMGHVAHLFERECSIQRRHQKIIEETPSVALTPALRARMAQAAVDAASTVGYQNAGTVEFILASDGSFYFLEMNTRLQVEHPITELVTGHDLVREQIRVAQGEPLSLDPATLRQTGHAIECRIYAEDPSQQFRPDSGRVVVYEPPRGPGVRLDSGIRQGSEVSIYYDPMLAKLAVWALDRPAALARMRRALSEFVILGLANNIEFLRNVIIHPAFERGEINTEFLSTHPEVFNGQPEGSSAEAAALVASLLIQEDGTGRGSAQKPKPVAVTRDPWHELGPWSNA